MYLPTYKNPDMESGAKFPSALRAQLARMTQNFVDRDDDDEFDDESSSLRKARPTTAAVLFFNLTTSQKIDI